MCNNCYQSGLEWRRDLSPESIIKMQDLVDKAKHKLDLEIPKEMDDWKKILEMGAKKHGANNWLDPDGKKSSEREMQDSMFHHLAKSFASSQEFSPRGFRFDKESNLDHLLHLACRALMLYTRRQKGIVHKEDKK